MFSEVVKEISKTLYVTSMVEIDDLMPSPVPIQNALLALAKKRRQDLKPAVCDIISPECGMEFDGVY